MAERGRETGRLGIRVLVMLVFLLALCWPFLRTEAPTTGAAILYESLVWLALVITLWVLSRFESGDDDGEAPRV